MNARRLWLASALFAVALVPTVAHVYVPPPPLEAGALARELDLADAEPGPRNARFAEKFRAVDFVSTLDGGVEFFAARTYDWKKLFHFPENDLAYGHARTAYDVQRIGELPVHVLRFETAESTRMALYALFLDREPVGNPYRFLTARVPSLLFRRRPPMTLLYVQGEVRGEADERALRERLADAAGRFSR